MACLLPTVIVPVLSKSTTSASPAVSMAFPDFATILLLYSRDIPERPMAGSTVNISFNRELLAEIDKTAKQEARTRSELIREAARLYIERKSRWESIFTFGSRQVRRLGLREEDVADEIKKSRAKKESRKA